MDRQDTSHCFVYHVTVPHLSPCKIGEVFMSQSNYKHKGQVNSIIYYKLFNLSVATKQRHGSWSWNL